MGSSRNYTNGLKKRVILMLIISFTFLSSKSVNSPVGSVFIRGMEGVKQVKMVLGSRPPQCVNKCLNCRPCVATLVVPSHPKNRFKVSSQEDENYYLLTWKCRCGNNLFQP
ncbi:hypothetical protein ACOSP7_015565 [Xanthoceras sorbifolium]|uniref:Epidermal patterning factor-like protein n=1 Tax=Xanthoceras sorbifolium TaxID=99658 RepID=A0ABQ8I7V3_9ROSI|nr:hypothetical protein JRO89_XS04G0252700 [Xanthoceras sorbifolium]